MALFAQADAVRLPLADQSVDLVVGSPPYCDARTYLEDGEDLGIARDAFEWVEWMLAVTTEALRVSRGLVIWVAAGVTRERTYWPAVEGLIWEWYKRGGSSYRPCYWHRVGIPGNGGDQWYRADVEICPILAIKRPGPLPYAEPTANGHPAKCGPGGPMSNRTADGSRVDGRVFNLTTSRGKNGVRETAREYPSHERYRAEGLIANPGNLISTGAGGSSHLGNAAASLNEAPFPEAVPEFFVRSHCPPGGIVLDPFSGSGTTAAAAERLGRSAIGFDLRLSQARLATRRTTRPHAPTPRRSARGDTSALPLFDALEDPA